MRAERRRLGAGPPSETYVPGVHIGLLSPALHEKRRGIEEGCAPGRTGGAARTIPVDAGGDLELELDDLQVVEASLDRPG